MQACLLERGLNRMGIQYRRVAPPKVFDNYRPVDLTKETMIEHLDKVLERMKQKDLDVLVVYADREHGSNFAYLTGFEPRFEEALLVLHKDRTCVLMLGNENLKMANYSYVKGNIVHVPHFSLPGQLMETTSTLEELMQQAGLRDRMKIGISGWKYFSSRLEDNTQLYDVPSFMVDAIRRVNTNGTVVSVGDIFLDPESGVRNIMNANEIAHYEFGAGLASSRIWDALNEIEIGKTEMEIANILSAYGQPTNVTTICATGERFTNAVAFPRFKMIEKGDWFSLTLGFRGGLSSRAAYIAETEKDLPEGQQDYIEKVAIPYYRAAITWLETIGIGVSCAEIYQKIEIVLPKAQYHWSLNPGHYTGQDEWTVSPITAESKVCLASGMILQMDIIPSVPGYGGVSAEDGVAIADDNLRKELEEKYPDTWNRMQVRRKYLKEELGLNLKEEILPMSDILGYLRPLLLNKEYALSVK